jgi:hypothetical protein
LNLLFVVPDEILAGTKYLGGGAIIKIKDDLLGLWNMDWKLRMLPTDAPVNPPE